MASPRQFVKKLYSYCVFLCAGIFNDIFLIATFFLNFQKIQNTISSKIHEQCPILEVFDGHASDVPFVG